MAGVKSEVTYENPTMIRVYRDEISRHLIDEGKRLYPDAITFHFDSPITSVDFEKRVAQISGTQEVSSIVFLLQNTLYSSMKLSVLAE